MTKRLHEHESCQLFKSQIAAGRKEFLSDVLYFTLLYLWPEGRTVRIIGGRGLWVGGAPLWTAERATGDPLCPRKCAKKRIIQTLGFVLIPCPALATSFSFSKDNEYLFDSTHLSKSKSWDACGDLTWPKKIWMILQSAFWLDPSLFFYSDSESCSAGESSWLPYSGYTLRNTWPPQGLCRHCPLPAFMLNVCSSINIKEQLLSFRTAFELFVTSNLISSSFSNTIMTECSQKCSVHLHNENQCSGYNS